ncbi:MAG TPA: peptidoglycan DD-metalloendopeptidase family protein [Steroidobacteraceae bacterium]|nr:peptidoglycan DD-metalloendopeptidase family protein [Steroidobacteraceae bacterium]
MATATTTALLSLALALDSGVLPAQTAYKYKDANGQWVFTDSAPPAAQRNESTSTFTLAHEDGSLNLTIERADHQGVTDFTAVNACLCVATFRLTINASDDPRIPSGAEYYKVLRPRSRELLITVANAGRGKSSLRYRWMAAPGAPDAEHHPDRPYRAPFAIGSTFVISQAYPSTFTHTTPDSRYAVDIALPDGTPVYAAREGTVIDARHDKFLGGVSPVMLDQANQVTILHADGTIGLYGHLHWDSIRVHIGEHVGRGQYIANSGSTGFSSGPHLHFAVIRNDGMTVLSVPIVFAGPSGLPVTPETHKELTAY